MSDTPIFDKIEAFTNLGIHVAFLVPTETGYKKSIMDATYNVRSLLLDEKIHDYRSQEQGPDNKVLINSYLMMPDGYKETKAALYRPITKKGDPRIWFYNLKDYCQPNNLLSLFIYKDSIYVINLSNPKIYDSFLNGYIHSFLINIVQGQNKIVIELRDKIQKIHDNGFLKTITFGDPGVGDTLENALGIKRNPNKNPDYKGIELKAYRGKLKDNRSTLFDQKPDWENSFIQSSSQLIDYCGYWTEEKKRYDLHCTIYYKKPNGQGLYNELDSDYSTLKTYRVLPPDPPIPIVQWSVNTLKQRLIQKHPKTFWVKASTQEIDGSEWFRYDHIIYTRDPNASIFPDLIEQGVITVDFLIKKENGHTKDKGYPFKIKKQYLDSLFPSNYTFDLEKKEYAMLF